MTGARVLIRVAGPLGMPGDVLVRPVNATLQGITPWSRQVEIDAGERLRARLEGQAGVPAGGVVLTPAGDLPYDFLIHAVLLTPEEAIGRATLERAVANVLRRAAEWEIERLVLPLLGVGPGQLDVETAAEILVDGLLADGVGPDGSPTAFAKLRELLIPVSGAYEARVVRDTLVAGIPGIIVDIVDAGDAE